MNYQIILKAYELFKRQVQNKFLHLVSSGRYDYYNEELMLYVAMTEKAIDDSAINRLDYQSQKHLERFGTTKKRKYVSP